KASSDIRAGRRRLEVVHHASERLVDAEQFALEELARFLGVAALARAAVPQEHVPDIFVAGPNVARRAFRQNVLQEIAEGSFPTLRAMLLAEAKQGIYKIRRSRPLF